MAKMRIFKFWNEAGEEKEKEAMSLKKATRSVQGDFKESQIALNILVKGKQCHYINMQLAEKLEKAILEKKDCT